MGGVDATDGGTDAAGQPAFVPMKTGHLAFLASDAWADMLRSDLLPWLTQSRDLGGHVLEIGPGPGRTTDLLRERASRVTALELDEHLAAALESRMASTNVAVVRGDATAIDLPGVVFSAVTCFHVLHHVPSVELQDRLLAETCRVLEPGGSLLLADAVDLAEVRSRHEAEGETFLPLDPGTLEHRLRSAGFADAAVEVRGYQLLVSARK